MDFVCLTFLLMKQERHGLSAVRNSIVETDDNPVQAHPIAATDLFPEMKLSLRESWSPPGAGPQAERIFHAQTCSSAVGVLRKSFCFQVGG